MAPWHRTRYFNSLRQQERAQRKAIAAMNKKSDTAVGHGASKGTGGGVGGGHGGGGGAGGGGGGTMDLTGDILNNMKYAENDRDGSHAAGNGLQGESGAGQGDTTEKRDGHVTEGEVSIESKEEMDIERKHGDDRGIGEGDEEVEEEEEADYQWRDEDDDEEDDMFDTSLPQMEDLEEEVSLPRLFGGHCSVNMFIEDDERAQPAPASTLKHLQSLSKARGNACNEQKKRKRASAGGGKAKAQPKPVAVPKGRGGAGGGAGKAAPQTASAAPDAGQRAEAGDLSGLLVNGLFMTSVLIVDAYLVAKDAAIEKVRTVLYSTLLYSTLLYFTLLYSTLLYSTLLYSTLLYTTLHYSTLLYSSLLHPTSKSVFSRKPLIFCSLIAIFSNPFPIPSTPDSSFFFPS